MRFDLTHASVRVLERASKQYLPQVSSEMTAAKLLISLFQENECRAAEWLASANLTLESFQAAFRLDHASSTLSSPISAPFFPVGSYGIPPASTQEPVERDANEVEASPAGNDAPSVGTPEPHPEPDRKREPPHSEHRHDEPGDEWTESGAETDAMQRRFYSIYSKVPTEPNRHSQARFFLDDQPIHIGRLSKELESAFELLNCQFGMQGVDRRRISSVGGGIATITTRNFDSRIPGFPLATEHLLLAAVLDEGDVGLWLRENGFDPTELFQRIGHLSGPVRDDRFSEQADDKRVDPSDAPWEPDEAPDLPAQEVANLYRLLDAASNRAREAIRVIEDFVRFALNDSELTRSLKEFRHEFHRVLEPLALSHRLEGRDTEQDVGTEIEGEGEYRRQTIRDVLSANFARLQESLRSLEEFSKLDALSWAPSVSRRLEQLRYRSYTLHKTICLKELPDGDPDRDPNSDPDGADATPSIADNGTGAFPRSLDEVRLYALVDAGENEEQFTRTVRALIDGGVDMIQLRDKKADDRTLLARSGTLRDEISSAEKRVYFMMNDRPDLARLADADGVHVGQEELPVDQVRKIVGPHLWIGVSTHRIEEARQAVLDGADYLGAGPVFESSTKSFGDRYPSLPGLDFLREVADEIRIPAFAIGGITWDNLDDVLDTGLNRVAVSSALLDAEDPGEEARRFALRLKEKEPSPPEPPDETT